MLEESTFKERKNKRKEVERIDQKDFDKSNKKVDEAAL